MEKKDLDLIAEMADKSPEVKALWEEHLLYEKQLEKLEKKTYRTPEEERVMKEIKKKKLMGKTKLQKVLDRRLEEV
ncbi:DUF465 domain-containing protein [Desulfocurvus sp.]|jgi:hypothetical protein|uniref:DUF465 domain-containing protein n=1 Tax=Desulfocurvus sp. TaxID=2871698 RepID=UPI0025C4841F|nr:DUF465 domain-containing protein [Desulfocurvus sp.]MCK9239490.1 DUF465 domain-containing protein [Desulfocurvus sp.]